MLLSDVFGAGLPTLPSRLTEGLPNRPDRFPSTVNRIMPTSGERQLSGLLDKWRKKNSQLTQTACQHRLRGLDKRST